MVEISLHLVRKKLKKEENKMTGEGIKGFWYQFHCGRGGSPTSSNNSQTPAGCRRSQFNSVTTYLEIESESTGLGFSPTKLLPALDTGHQPRLLAVFLTNQLQIGGSNVPLQLRMPITSPNYQLYFWLTGYIYFYILFFGSHSLILKFIFLKYSWFTMLC